MEETPTFDSAVERLQRFLSEQGWPTDVVWRFEKDIVRLPQAEIVVRRRSTSQAVQAAK
jgi:hypothetical protein